MEREVGKLRSVLARRESGRQSLAARSVSFVNDVGRAGHRARLRGRPNVTRIALSSGIDDDVAMTTTARCWCEPRAEMDGASSGDGAVRPRSSSAGALLLWLQPRVGTHAILRPARSPRLRGLH